MAEKMVLSEMQSTFLVGIVCSGCGCHHLPVYKTVNHDHKIVRYRKCRHCGKTVTSIERVVRK